MREFLGFRRQIMCGRLIDDGVAGFSIGIRSHGGADALYEAATSYTTHSGSGWVSDIVLFDADPRLGRAEQHVLGFVRVAVEGVHIGMRCRMLAGSASFYFLSAPWTPVMC